MTQIEKLVEKILKTKTDIEFSDFKKFLEYYEYKLIRKKGSHFHFRKLDSPFITIPVHNNKIKKVYLKEIIKIVKL
ncbi:type II toxin-antitoxin system HicA family toxin [Patescibacteria group bacterium]|nr:type II toxin-antitoxin system HicA family toxin [Patescibacteria group bacterium]